jgi:hypothetical protein
LDWILIELNFATMSSFPYSGQAPIAFSGKHNGRVNIVTPDMGVKFSMMDRVPARQCVTYRDANAGLWDDTVLSNTYYSSANIQILQNAIRRGVYDRSNQQYLLGEQDCTELKTIMRSIFLQYSRNLPDRIAEQIQELNRMVVNDVVQRLYSETQGYLQYIRDASSLVVPMAHPVMSNTHNKQLTMHSWFGNKSTSSSSRP